MNTLRKLIPPSFLLVGAGLLLPIALFYFLLARFATALPFEDDYGLFDFAMRWQDNTGWLNHARQILTSQHNDYKMFLEYLALGSEVGLTHHFHLYAWVWTANLLVLGILMLLWLDCAPTSSVRERLLLFLPPVWMVMNLGYWETLNWALCGVQEVTVTFLSLLCLYLATRKSNNKNLLACVVAALACGTYANAFLLAPIGLALFARRHKWHIFVCWTLSFVVVLVAFLYHYRFVPHQRGTVVSFILFFFAAVGDIGFHGIYLPAAVLGLAIVGALVYATRAGLQKDRPFAYWAIVWLMLGFALTSYGRSATGADAALAARYKIYSHLILALLYLLFLDEAQRKLVTTQSRQRAYAIVLTVSVFFAVANDMLGYFQLKRRHQWVSYGMDHYLASGGKESPMNYGPTALKNFGPAVEKNASVVLDKAIRRGLYTLPNSY